MYIYVYISSFLFVLLCGAGAHAALLETFFTWTRTGERGCSSWPAYPGAPPPALLLLRGLLLAFYYTGKRWSPFSIGARPPIFAANMLKI